jgi:hypothetical protein
MNYKYILLSLFFISLNLIAMVEDTGEELINCNRKKLNRLPDKLRLAIINNSFFENDVHLEETLDVIDWTSWTKEEINIICGILTSNNSKKHTPEILRYLMNLQILCEQENLRPSTAILKFQLLESFKVILDL